MISILSISFKHNFTLPYIFLGLFIVVILFRLFRSEFFLNFPSLRGNLGEKIVTGKLSALSKDEYIILNNLCFSMGNNTTQIDHIVVSMYGIFIIETKSHKGWIYGNPNTDYWTQNIYGRRYKLYNPIFQNKNHINFIKKKFQFIEKDSPFIHSIVVFTRTSQIRLTNESDYVLTCDDLLPYIWSFRKQIMTDREVQRIAEKFVRENISDRNKRKQHVKNVRSAETYHSQRLNRGFCPCCNGKLVIRSGKYGNFYGCSNYPKCRYIKSI